MCTCMYVCVKILVSPPRKGIYQQIHWAQPEQAESGDVQSLFFFLIKLSLFSKKNFLLLFPLNPFAWYKLPMKQPLLHYFFSLFLFILDLEFFAAN